jgi:type I restriction-modification system DNA methylase subunit
VPFLGRGGQDEVLAVHLAARFDVAKADLATAMLERMRLLAAKGGTVAAVTPQNWLFLGSYKALRRRLLKTAQLNINVALGPAAFREMNWWAIQTALTTWTASLPQRIQLS